MRPVNVSVKSRFALVKTSMTASPTRLSGGRENVAFRT